jgi:hypothetical protein
MKPTKRQLNYLRALAQRTGQTFTWPATADDASAEIKRLQRTTATPRADRRREDREVRNAVATAHGDAAAVRASEISGYGSTATWARDRVGEKPAEPKSKPGKRVELGRYSIAEGERIIYGQRVDGVVRVTDRPAEGKGRAFLIERGLKSNDELQAVVADYISESERRGEPAAIVRVGDELAAVLAS